MLFFPRNERETEKLGFIRKNGTYIGKEALSLKNCFLLKSQTERNVCFTKENEEKVNKTKLFVETRRREKTIRFL